ncbi:non-heme chloroperoxidase [Nocardia sp. GAS34]|uniref:alpha/beta fold hydrolase n=1 Tax=unclassified Nocardia TaxID=2637762 RepID=UPI003D200619
MFFTTPTDGTTLAYEEYGTGEPIVFLAGAMLNADMWECQIPFFVERGYRCIALDRRGHGRSDRPVSGYDIATTSADMEALLDHLDLRDATLVGHSTGGAEIAHYLARRGTERVARVAYVAAILPYLLQAQDNPIGVPEAALEAMLHDIRTDRSNWLARQTQAYFATHLATGVSPSQVDLTYQQCLSCSPWAMLKIQEAIARCDSREALRSFDIDTLIVHGAADFSAPVEVTGRQLAAALPEAVYKEYPTGGHGLYASHADQLNADLLEFIKA